MSGTIFSNILPSLADEQVFDCDVFLVEIGIRPHHELAAQMGPSSTSSVNCVRRPS